MSDNYGADTAIPNIPLTVTDVTGREWQAVPGFTSAGMRSSNGQPLRTSKPIVVVQKKAPPRHPDYDANAKKYAFFEASYRGGSDYKKAKDADGDEVFCKHPNESEASAKMRKRLAVVRNYCYPIVNKLGNFIFGQPIVRDTSPGFVEWQEDVDGNGTSLSQFMEDAADAARYLGIWGIIFDTTKQDDHETQAQAKARGNRPVLSCLHPNRILNWTSDYKQLLIQHDVGEFGQAWLWTETDITKYPLDDKGKVAGPGLTERHGYPVMPIVLVSGLNDFSSLIKDIAELQKRLFHYDSVLIEELVRQTFTSYLLMGVDAAELDQTAPVSVGGRKFTCIAKSPSQGNIAVEKIGSDISQADSLRASIDADEKEIYRTIGLRVPDAETRPESGRALRIREGETVAIAERIAQNVQRAEEELMDLYNFATGSAIEAPQYPDEFQQDDLQILLADTLSVLGSQFGPQLKAQQSIKYIRQAFKELDPSVREALELEAQKQAAEAEKAAQQMKQLAVQAVQGGLPPGVPPSPDETSRAEGESKAEGIFPSPVQPTGQKGQQQ